MSLARSSSFVDSLNQVDMAQNPSTTISLLSDDDQNIERQPGDSTGEDLSVSSAGLTSPSGSTTDHPSQMHPDHYRHESGMTLTEIPTSSRPGSHTPRIESQIQSTQLDQKETQAHVPQRQTQGFRHWGWEAVYSVLLLVMIIATIITLRLHDGQLVPDWPLSISINALISTYAFVFKGTMALILGTCIGQLQWSWFRTRHPLKDVTLFQDAGRSPYGAFIWLCKLHLHQPVVAMAALATILGIALDPFFQQLAQLTTCTVPLASGQKPSIPRTNFLNMTGNSITDLEDFRTSLGAALVSGYHQPPGLPSVDCSTGNCTFHSEYSTLAFCSQCQDISDQMEVHGVCHGRYHFKNGTEMDFSCKFSRKFSPDCPPGYGATSEVLDIVTLSCNVTSSVDPIFSASFTTDSPQQLTVNSKFRATHEGTTNASALEWDWSEIWRGLDYGIIYAMDPWTNLPSQGCQNILTNNTWSCRGYGAATCFIQPCVNTYTANINSGRLDETLIDSSTDVLWGLSPVWPALSILDKSCISEAERTQIINAGYDLDSHGQWLAYNLTLQTPEATSGNSTPPPESFLLKRCVYSMNKDFINYLFEHILSYLLEGSVLEYALSPQQLRFLYNYGNVNMTGITSVFENVAQTLTLWVRTNGHPNYSEPAIGQAYHAATCIQANWNWLALPVVVASLTLIVLALTIITTQRRGLPLWKSSPLAFLLHGPGGLDWVDEAMVAPPCPKAKAADLRTRAGMESMAARIWVSLEAGDVAPRLRQVGMRRKSEP